MQQDARGRGEQDMRGVDGGRFLVGRRIEDASKAPAGVGDTVERQAGVSADKACGIAQCGIGGVKIGARVLAARVACPRKYSASAVAMARESGSEMPATAASICPGTKAVHINGMGTHG